jgi:carbonic anhydrase/acetyltransferase-like protein (isoleucine patch superfamily)
MLSMVYRLICRPPDNSGSHPMLMSSAACGWGSTSAFGLARSCAATTNRSRSAHGATFQEGAMLHADPGFPLVVGEDVTIGHHAIVHGCRIGEGSLIGMGATILNGARIGAGCLVGACALVTEGKEFPDHSLIVGSPAKATRLLDTAAVEGLLLSARQYVANWRRFKNGLQRID